MRVVFFYYKIPNGLFPNPSSRLRSYAIRTDGSVWMIPQSLVPWVMVNDMKRAGCVAHVIRADETDAAAIRASAIESLSEDAKRIVKDISKTIDTVREKLGDSSLNKADTELAMKYYATRRIKDVRRRILQAQEAAVVFEITSEVSDLLESISNAIEAKVAVLGSVLGRSSESPVSIGAAVPGRETNDEATQEIHL